VRLHYIQITGNQQQLLDDMKERLGMVTKDVQLSLGEQILNDKEQFMDVVEHCVMHHGDVHIRIDLEHNFVQQFYNDLLRKFGVCCMVQVVEHKFSQLNRFKF
jgi:hypothetical protein